MSFIFLYAIYALLLPCNQFFMTMAPKRQNKKLTMKVVDMTCTHIIAFVACVRNNACVFS